MVPAYGHRGPSALRATKLIFFYKYPKISIEGTPKPPKGSLGALNW
jgi:hypothetical protein